MGHISNKLKIDVNVMVYTLSYCDINFAWNARKKNVLWANLKYASSKYLQMPLKNNFLSKYSIIS